MIGLSWLYSAEILTDKKTGLAWQDNSDAKSMKKSWSDSKEYCQNLILEGQSDWRLPTIKELQSIVDIKKIYPAIKDDFKNVASGSYWSSSEFVSNTSRAWHVVFHTGSTSYRDKTKKYYVRCVRVR
jgi:hypothetical protein